MRLPVAFWRRRESATEGFDMDDEEPTLKGIAKEFTTPGYWGRARERSASSKTGWDLIFMPIGFAAIGGYWYSFTKLFLWFHLLVYPADAPRLQSITGGPMTVAQALIFLVPGFSALPLGFMTSNALMWLFPPARRASERKANGRKWATFRGAQLGLFKIALVLVPLA
jgi:hypothetical protein